MGRKGSSGGGRVGRDDVIRPEPFVPKVFFLFPRAQQHSTTTTPSRDVCSIHISTVENRCQAQDRGSSRKSSRRRFPIGFQSHTGDWLSRSRPLAAFAKLGRDGQTHCHKIYRASLGAFNYERTAEGLPSYSVPPVFEDNSNQVPLLTFPRCRQ